MKRTRKFLITALCVVLTLACAVMIIAACNESNAYTVTIADYDVAQGSVTVSQPASGDKYASGEDVTVTVTPNANYEVDTFTVSGHSDAVLTNNEYTFAITADTTVTVTFKQTLLPGQGFSITVSKYDTSKGSVEVSQPASGDKYAPNETVTVTVTPEDGYRAVSFTVSGHSNAQLSSDNKYSFNITANTTVTVAFAPERMLQSVFQSIQGSMLLRGEAREYDYLEGGSYLTNTSTLYDDEHRAVWIQEGYLGYVTFSAIYIDVDGMAAMLMHNEQGKLDPIVSEESVFEEFYNPFKWLDVSLFTPVGVEEWEIADLDVAKVVATAITGYKENIESIRFFEANGKIVKIQIETLRITHPEYGIDIQTIYTYSVTEHGFASIPAEYFEDYTESEEHEELREALQKAAATSSYTVRYHSEEPGYEDLDYNVFATQDGIYSDLAGWEGGYIKRADGSVWEFTYDPETEHFDFVSAPTYAQDIKQLFAKFIVDNISFSMLEYQGEGVFSLRFTDVVIGQYNTVFGSLFAMNFATGADQQRYFDTAVDFSIAIKDGELYKIGFTYNYYGLISEYVELTFENFDATDFPLEISDDIFNGTFAPEYVGTWVDDFGDYKVVITLDKLTINGEEITEVERNVDGSYDITWNGKSYLLYIDDEYLDGAMVISDGNFYNDVILYKSECKWIEFVGLYEGQDEDEVTYMVTITEEDLTVVIGSNVIVAENIYFDYIYSDDYEHKYHFFYFTLGEDGYYLLQIGDDNLVFMLFAADDDELEHSIVLERNNCKWVEFIGVFEGEENGVSYTIVITSKEVTVTIDGVTTVAEIVSYNSRDHFTIKLDGEIYYITNAEYTDEVNSIAFMPEDFRAWQAILDRVTGSQD